MGADRAKVIAIVQKALDNNATEPMGCDRVWAATEDVYNQRNDPTKPASSSDQNLAAAEHYLLAASMVACGEYTRDQVRDLALMYNLGKFVLPEKLVRHNPDKPATPASLEQISYAFHGADFGEILKKKHPPKKKPPLYGLPPSFVGKHKK